MKHSNFILNGIEKIFYHDVWKDIEEMPIYNWIKILETGDLKWVYKDGGRVSERTEEHWLDLQQQYIDEFGLDQEFEQQIRLKKELVRLRCEYVVTKDRFLNNLIKMREVDIKSSLNQKAVKFYEIKDVVEKYKGFRIDPKEISVKEWYHSIKNMSKYGEGN